jgi:hypothetical protein
VKATVALFRGLEVDVLNTVTVITEVSTLFAITQSLLVVMVDPIGPPEVTVMTSVGSSRLAATMPVRSSSPIMIRNVALALIPNTLEKIVVSLSI